MPACNNVNVGTAGFQADDVSFKDALGSQPAGVAPLDHPEPDAGTTDESNEHRR